MGEGAQEDKYKDNKITRRTSVKHKTSAISQQECRRGSCYGVHRTKVILSSHVATISVRVRRLNREDLGHVTKTSFIVTDAELHGQNVLVAVKLSLCVRVSSTMLHTPDCWQLEKLHC